VRFHNELVNLPELTATQTERGRMYNVPGGRAYPSITTVLGARPEKKKIIAEWRARVGEQEANKVSAQASRRGTSIHKMMEDWITGEPITGGLVDREMFATMHPYVDKYLQTVYAIEAPLYSHKLGVAGRCDLVGKWAGVNCIIDFKTSKRLKSEEHIDNYLLQATAYSIMFEELTSTIIPGIVILVGVDGEPKPQMFCRFRAKYVDQLYGVIADYYENSR